MSVLLASRALFRSGPSFNPGTEMARAFFLAAPAPRLCYNWLQLHHAMMAVCAYKKCVLSSVFVCAYVSRSVRRTYAGVCSAVYRFNIFAPPSHKDGACVRAFVHMTRDARHALYRRVTSRTTPHRAIHSRTL